MPLKYCTHFVVAPDRFINLVKWILTLVVYFCQSVSYVSGRFFVYFLSTLCFTLIASSTSCVFFHCLCHYLWVACNCLPVLKLVPFTFVSNLGCWSIGFLFQLLFFLFVISIDTLFTFNIHKITSTGRYFDGIYCIRK